MLYSTFFPTILLFDWCFVKCKVAIIFDFLKHSLAQSWARQTNLRSFLPFFLFSMQKIYGNQTLISRNDRFCCCRALTICFSIISFKTAIQGIFPQGFSLPTVQRFWSTYLNTIPNWLIIFQSKRPCKWKPNYLLDRGDDAEFRPSSFNLAIQHVNLD